MSIRSRALGLFDSAGATRALFALRGAGSPRFLTVLTWHRVDEPGAAEEVDSGVLDATPAEFEEQIDVVSRHFNVVGLEDVRRALTGDPLPPKPALITFDDGYLDGYVHALPVLRRAGVRATFFVATDPISKRVPFWWDSVAWIAKHAKRRRFDITYPTPRTFDLAHGTALVIHACLEIIKRTFALDVDRFVDQLASASDAPWDDSIKHALADRLLMTWDHIRALDRAGMEIASHTRTHRVLETLRASDLDSELTGARSDLGRELGHASRAIAYPVGGGVSHLPEVRRALERAGYDLGFTYMTGFQKLSNPMDRYAIRRLAVDRGTTSAHLRTRLATLDAVT